MQVPRNDTSVFITHNISAKMLLKFGYQLSSTIEGFRGNFSFRLIDPPFLTDRCFVPVLRRAA
jgi:hypothetical protein